jgi:hypothetical protein
VFLLIVRAVAAPIAMRPRVVDAGSCVRHVLVLRICSWPPQRLQRFSARSKLLELRQGRNRLASGLKRRPPGFRTAWSSLTSPPPSHAPAGLRGMSAILPTGRLRC